MKINIKKKLKSAGSTIKGMGSIDKKSLKNRVLQYGNHCYCDRGAGRYKPDRWTDSGKIYPGGCKYPEAVYDL